MANLDLLLKALDSAVWEMGEGFKVLPDEDVWQRPHPRLLSVGEVAVHVAYWEAQSFLGEGFDSPLVQAETPYYSSSVDKPIALALTGDQVYAEVKRVHEACKAAFLADPHDSEELNAKRAENQWTWGATLEYQVFHFGYHTGQIYSARHLLGHETIDN